MSEEQPENGKASEEDVKQPEDEQQEEPKEEQGE